MDLDLITNGGKIRDCLSSLTNGKISWIVLGYSGNKTICVIETGDDSFEDMFEEFDANKIMYGFAAVTDPNTKLKKNVFIYWQGEAASQSMKTVSVQHSNVIRDLCKPVHVTHNARDEQDLDLKEIMTKIASASGSNYSYHNETKQVFQHAASVKSEENTASNLRQNRLKELSALGSIQKETIQEQHVGSTYEKVDAMKEIKNLRSNKFEGTTPPKPTVSAYSKVDAAKEIRSAYPSKNFQSSQNANPNISKDIKPSVVIAPKNVNTGYKKINPEQEFKSLNTSQKSTFESKIKVQSENNTAERAKEERQKELSNLFSKKVSCDIESDQKVGTNYTKVNPAAEIKKLRSASITHDDDVPVVTPSSYKKIDPNAEIQKLRRSSSSENNEPTSPGTTYKKINPAEEIKKLRSQNSFADVPTINTGYKKINPIEEITSARKHSTPFIKSEDSNKISQGSDISNTTPATEVKRTSMFSARQSFENVHKNDTHHPHTFQFSNQATIPETQNIKHEISHVNTKVENIRSPPVIEQNVPIVTKNVTSPTIVSKEIIPEIKESKNTAEAQFSYDATDTDEISFVEGEIIRDIEIIDDDWWIGVNTAGQKGMFPSNYVMPLDMQMSKKDDPHVNSPEPHVEENQNNHDNKEKNHENITTISAPKSPQLDHNANITAVAIFDYQANDCDEISFDIGDIIKEIEQIDDGWWVGVNQAGQKGMFPSNFVEIENNKGLDQHKSSKIIEDTPSSPQVPSKDSTKVIAIFDYQSQDDDELSFKTGDMIYNISTVDEGWSEGELANGTRGLFPSNYVEAV